MSNILLPVFYLPPVSWFSVFIADENEVTFEQWENFPKQTYRNRANIYGANGKLPLIIPVKHSGTRLYRDLEISYAEDWQKIHWKSIKTAYQGSPYFEYYEDRLRPIFENQPTKLFDFNLKALEILQHILKSQKAYSLNNEYLKNPEGQDYRAYFSAKEATKLPVKRYYQTFEQKYGFIEDLSIVDLLCNIGPESLTYLKNLSKD